MKLQLTPELLLFLEQQGFHYCYAKTLVCEDDDCFDITITLTPIRYRPYIRKLPIQYDSYYAMNKEPKQLAFGVEGVRVLVDLEVNLTVLYIGSQLKPPIAGRKFQN